MNSGDGCAGIPADVFMVDEWRRRFIALADNQQKQAKTALEKCSICPLFLKYTVAPANMLLLIRLSR